MRVKNSETVASSTSLNTTFLLFQVKTWFANARRRRAQMQDKRDRESPSRQKYQRQKENKECQKVKDEIDDTASVGKDISKTNNDEREVKWSRWRIF